MPAKLNADHIAAINAAMHAGEAMVKNSDGASVVELAAGVLREQGWETWDTQKLFQTIRNNEVLRVRWMASQEPSNDIVAPLETQMTDIHRPLSLSEQAGETLPDSIEDGLSLGSLEQHEEQFRTQLKALGEDQTTVDFMVAAGNLQSKFALCTLNAVTGGLVKSYNELRKAQKETMDDLKELLSIEDPVAKALLSEREKILRDFFIQLHECQLGAFDRINKAFFLQLEARKLESKKGQNMGRPKKMLGITAMPGSRVAVQVNGNGAHE